MPLTMVRYWEKKWGQYFFILCVLSCSFCPLPLLMLLLFEEKTYILYVKALLCCTKKIVAII